MSMTFTIDFVHVLNSFCFFMSGCFATMALFAHLLKDLLELETKPFWYYLICSVLMLFIGYM